MGLMVGDRRFPGATILGGRFSTSSANHPVSVPPTGLVLRDGWSSGLCTRWRASRGVSCCGSHYPLPRRCGDVFFLSYAVSSGLLEVSSYLFAPHLFPSSRPAHPTLSRLCRILRWPRSDFPVGSTSSSSDRQSSPACHGQSAGITFQLSHMHAWGRLVVHFSIFFTSRGFGSISTRGTALSCVRTDGVLTSTLSPGRAAGDHSVQTAVRCEGMRISQMCKCNGTKCSGVF